MFSCINQTIFAKSIQRPLPSRAVVVFKIPVKPFHLSSSTKNSQLNLAFHSTWTALQDWKLPSILQIKRLPFISRNYVTYPHASQLLAKMSERHKQENMSDHILLCDVFKTVQSFLPISNSRNVGTVHALVVKSGALADLHTTSLLLTLYSRAHEFESSLALFNDVLDRDVVFWNAMVSACVESKSFENAIVLFKRMFFEESEFDATSLVIVVSASSNSKSIDLGLCFHGLSVRAGMVRGTVLGNALIDMYAKCGDLNSSECMFAELECKDLVSWNSIITGCFYNSHPEKSLWYFKRLSSSEIKVDHISISCAISACSALHQFDLGYACHGQGIKLAYAESNYASVDNSLISFYSQSQNISAAERIFADMFSKNVISWNVMIKGFLSNGEIVQGLRLVRDMQFVHRIEPDSTTLVTVIPFCAELLLLREGRAAHGFTIRREMSSELSVTNSLINMYSKCGDVNIAEYLFFTMRNKDMIAWNTMIAGYSQNGLSREAQTLFKKMMGCFPSWNLSTLLAIIQSSDSPHSIQFGKSIHSWSIKLGFSMQIYASNSLIHMYINCGFLLDALRLFGTISRRADVFTWNTLITGCTQKSHFAEALEYFDSMRKSSKVLCNPITITSVIMACGYLGLHLQGKLIHGLALKNGTGMNLQVQNSIVTMYGRLGDAKSASLAFNLSEDHNLCSWNCVISAMSQNEDAKRALELFRSLEFEPNEITISTVLSACTQLGAMSYGKQIHGQVFRFSLHKNPFISAALIDMYSNCGSLGIAEQVFLTSQVKSVSCWNSLISAYGFHNHSSKAVQTFQEMIESGNSPTSGSFTSLLQACCHTGMVETGLDYYNNMSERFQFQPTVEHRVCVVDMLGRSGKLKEAYDFIRKLPGEPEAEIWGALLSSCGYHVDLEMGRKVADILFRLEPENVSYYVCLCNMYVAAERWEEAVELRAVIEEKQLKKTAGYSFIDVSFK